MADWPRSAVGRPTVGWAALLLNPLDDNADTDGYHYWRPTSRVARGLGTAGTSTLSTVGGASGSGGHTDPRGSTARCPTTTSCAVAWYLFL